MEPKQFKLITQNKVQTKMPKAVKLLWQQHLTCSAVSQSFLNKFLLIKLKYKLQTMKKDILQKQNKTKTHTKTFKEKKEKCALRRQKTKIHIHMLFPQY